MFSLRLLAAFGLLGALVAVAGCVYDNDPPRQLASSPDAPGVSGPSGAATAPTSNVPAPMLVTVDTDQTMNAAGGDGVGVFIEYGKGGHWHLWWTCDTNQTQQSCDFSVTAKVASGKLANVDAADLPGGFVTSPSPTEVDAKSTTTTGVSGIHFDTDPGAVLTLQASVGNLTDGAFLFFVQDGKLNGGFAGKLTNPLQLQGSTP